MHGPAQPFSDTNTDTNFDAQISDLRLRTAEDILRLLDDGELLLLRLLKQIPLCGSTDCGATLTIRKLLASLERLLLNGHVEIVTS